MKQDLKEFVIQGLASDKDIYAYGSLLAYWEFTENPLNGFTEMPHPDYIVEKIKSAISKDLNFIDISVEESEVPLTEIFNNPGFQEFIRERTITELTRLIADLPIFSIDENISQTDFSKSIKIKVDHKKDFLNNFHYNLVVNRDLMRIITSTMVLSKKIDQSRSEYNYISDKTYEIMHVVFESMDKKFATILQSKQINFNEFASFSYLKVFTNAFVNKVSINASPVDFERLIHVFIAELKDMNRGYVVQVYEEKTPILNEIHKIIKEIEHSRDN